MDFLRAVVNKNFYAVVAFSAFVYYLFFAQGPLPGFWEKILIIFVGLIIFTFYFFVKTIGNKNKIDNHKRDSLTKILFASLLLPFFLAICHYFVLLIFFGKNPPVAVGIPYSIYSFSVGKIIFTGLVYDVLFYSLIIFILNRVRSDDKV